MASPERERATKLVGPVRTHLPSTMLEKPGAVLRFLFRRFFSGVTLEDEAIARLRAAAERGTVVYVLRAESIIEYLYFNHVLAQHGLPLARFANGVSTLLLQEVGRVFAYLRSRLRGELGPAYETESLREHVQQGESVLWFLTSPRPFLRRKEPDLPVAEALIALQRERDEGNGHQGGQRPILLVPMSVIWGLRPKREAGLQPTLVDRLFGEREAPGRLRELLGMMRHRKNALVRVGEPVSLREFLAHEAGAGEPVLARRLRWAVSGAIERELRVVAGPRRKGARRVRDEVLRRRKVHEAAREVAATSGDISPAAVEKQLRRAQRLVSEMASDMRSGYIQGMRVVFDALFPRLYDGIEVDVQGLEKVKEAARSGSLLLLPSHRSHLDYIILSFVFVLHHMVPPHIAAGINLSFWPMGHIFRRAGAFFIRRTVKGDPLYQVLLREYMRALLKAGHSIEFFIEGTRSRSGKLLAPKMGLLGMVADSLIEGDLGATRVFCAPLSIGYEKVIEVRSYAEERQGGEKRKEDLGALIRARRAFRTRYGRVNVQFHEPFDLREALVQGGLPALEDLQATASEELRRTAVRRVSYRAVDGINRVTAVTPTSLLAVGLLCRGNRGISRPQLARAIDFLLTFAWRGGARLSRDLADEVVGRTGGPGEVPSSVERALDLLARDGDVEIRGDIGIDPDQVVYRVPEERRPKLDYYKNAAVHVYVEAAIVCAALSRLEPPPPVGMSLADYSGPVPRAELRERVLELSRLLKLEFVFRAAAGQSGLDSTLETTLSQLRALGAVVLTRERVRIAPRFRREVVLLGGMIRELLEAYLVLVTVVERLLGAAGAAPRSEKELVAACLDQGERALALGEVTRREALSRSTFQNALALLLERAIVAREHHAPTQDHDPEPGRAAQVAVALYRLLDPGALAGLGQGLRTLCVTPSA